MSATAALKGIGKKIGKQLGKASKKTKDAIKRGYDSAVKEGSKKTAKTTAKKPISKKEFTKRGSATGKSKYGTKGSSKGYAAYVKGFNKTGKTTGKGTKGKGTKTKKSILDRNINPISGKKTIRGTGKAIGNVVSWARKNPVDAIVYGAAGNWVGKKLGLWGGKGSKNTPEVPKMEKRNYIPKSKNKSIERTGGPIKAYGGRKAPAMKSGGGLRYVNGKWIRD